MPLPHYPSRSYSLRYFNLYRIKNSINKSYKIIGFQYEPIYGWCDVEGLVGPTGQPGNPGMGWCDVEGLVGPTGQPGNPGMSFRLWNLIKIKSKIDDRRRI